MKRIDKRSLKDNIQEEHLPLSRCNHNFFNNLNHVDTHTNSESRRSSFEECVFTPQFHNRNNKNTINIKIKKNINTNSQYSEKKKKKNENKSFIKSMVDKIDEMCKKGLYDEKNNSQKLPFKSRPTFILNEYLNVEPTNTVMYRRRTPNETLRRSDFNGINLKPFIRLKSHHNCGRSKDKNSNKSNNICNNCISEERRKKATIKITSKSPFQTFNSNFMSRNQSPSIHPNPVNYSSLRNNIINKDLTFRNDEKGKKKVIPPVRTHKLKKLSDGLTCNASMIFTPFMNSIADKRYANDYPLCKWGETNEVNRNGTRHLSRTDLEENFYNDTKEGEKTRTMKEKKSQLKVEKMNKIIHHRNDFFNNSYNHLIIANEKNLKEKKKTKNKFRVRMSVPLNRNSGRYCEEKGNRTNMDRNSNATTNTSKFLFTSKTDRGMNLNLKKGLSKDIKFRYVHNNNEEKKSAKKRYHSSIICDMDNHNNNESSSNSSSDEIPNGICSVDNKCDKGDLKTHCNHGRSKCSSKGSNISEHETNIGKKLEISKGIKKRENVDMWDKVPGRSYSEYEKRCLNKKNEKRMRKKFSHYKTQTEHNIYIPDNHSENRHHSTSCFQIRDNKNMESDEFAESMNSNKSREFSKIRNCHSQHSIETKKNVVNKLGVEKEKSNNERNFCSLTRYNYKLDQDTYNKKKFPNYKILKGRNQTCDSVNYKLSNSTGRKNKNHTDLNHENSPSYYNSLNGKDKYKNLKTITIRSDSADKLNKEDLKRTEEDTTRTIMQNNEKYSFHHDNKSNYNLLDEPNSHEDYGNKYKLVHYYNQNEKKNNNDQNSTREDKAYENYTNKIEGDIHSFAKVKHLVDENKVLEIEDKRGRTTMSIPILSHGKKHSKKEEFPSDLIGKKGMSICSYHGGLRCTDIISSAIENNGNDSYYDNEKISCSEGKKKKKKSNFYSKHIASSIGKERKEANQTIPKEFTYNSKTFYRMNECKSPNGHCSNCFHNIVRGKKNENCDYPIPNQDQMEYTNTRDAFYGGRKKQQSRSIYRNYKNGSYCGSHEQVNRGGMRHSFSTKKTSHVTCSENCIRNGQELLSHASLEGEISYIKQNEEKKELHQNIEDQLVKDKNYTLMLPLTKKHMLLNGNVLGEEIEYYKENSQTHRGKSKSKGNRTSVADITDELSFGHQLMARNTKETNMQRRAEEAISTNYDDEYQTHSRVSRKMCDKYSRQPKEDRQDEVERHKKNKKSSRQYSEQNTHSQHHLKSEWTPVQSPQLFCKEICDKKNNKMRTVLLSDSSEQKVNSLLRKRQEVLKDAHSRKQITNSIEIFHKKNAYLGMDRCDISRNGTPWKCASSTSSSSFCDYSGMNNVERILYNSEGLSNEERYRCRKDGEGGNYSNRRNHHGIIQTITGGSLTHHSGNNTSCYKKMNRSNLSRKHVRERTLPEKRVNSIPHLNGNDTMSKTSKSLSRDEHGHSSFFHSRDNVVSSENGENNSNCIEINRICSNRNKLKIRNTQSKDHNGHNDYGCRTCSLHRGKYVCGIMDKPMNGERRVYDASMYQIDQRGLHDKKRNTTDEKLWNLPTSSIYYAQDEYKKKKNVNQRMNKSSRRGGSTYNNHNPYLEHSSFDQFTNLNNINCPINGETYARKNQDDEKHDVLKVTNTERDNLRQNKNRTKSCISSTEKEHKSGEILRENCVKKKTYDNCVVDSLLKEENIPIGNCLYKLNEKSSNENSFKHLRDDSLRNTNCSKHRYDHKKELISDLENKSHISFDGIDRSMSIRRGTSACRSDNFREEFHKCKFSNDDYVEGKCYQTCRSKNKEYDSDNKSYYEREVVNPHNILQKMENKKKHQNEVANKYNKVRERKCNNKSYHSQFCSEYSQRNNPVSGIYIMKRSDEHNSCSENSSCALSRSNISHINGKKKKNTKDSDINLNLHNREHKNVNKESRIWHNDQVEGGKKKCYYSSSRTRRDEEKKENKAHTDILKTNCKWSWIKEKSRNKKHDHIISTECVDNKLAEKNSKANNTSHIHDNYANSCDNMYSDCESSNYSNKSEKKWSHKKISSKCVSKNSFNNEPSYIHKCSEEIGINPSRHGSNHARNGDLLRNVNKKENYKMLICNSKDDIRICRSNSKDDIKICRSNSKDDIKICRSNLKDDIKICCSNSKTSNLSKDDSNGMIQTCSPCKMIEYQTNVNIGKNDEPSYAQTHSSSLNHQINPTTDENTKEKENESKISERVNMHHFGMLDKENAMNRLLHQGNSHPNFINGNIHKNVLRKTVSGVVGIKNANEYMKKEFNYYLNCDNSIKNGNNYEKEKEKKKTGELSKLSFVKDNFKNGLSSTDMEKHKCSSGEVSDNVYSVLIGENNTINVLNNNEKEESFEKNNNSIGNIILPSGSQNTIGNLDLHSDNTSIDATNIMIGSELHNHTPSNDEKRDFISCNEKENEIKIIYPKEEAKGYNSKNYYNNISMNQSLKVANPCSTTHPKYNDMLYGNTNNSLFMNKQYSCMSEPALNHIIHEPYIGKNSLAIDQGLMNNYNLNGIYYSGKAFNNPDLGNINMHRHLYNSGFENRYGESANVTRSDIITSSVASMNHLNPQQRLNQNFSKTFQVPIETRDLTNGRNYNFATVGANAPLINSQICDGGIFYDANGKAYVIGRTGKSNSSALSVVGSYMSANNVGDSVIPSYHLSMNNKNKENLNNNELTRHTSHANLHINPSMNGEVPYVNNATNQVCGATNPVCGATNPVCGATNPVSGDNPITKDSRGMNLKKPMVIL